MRTLAEDLEMRREALVRGILQRYWRWQRGLTLGARGMVLDGTDRVLLVRHTYTRGWMFPGGGVERGETALEALERELGEEANVTLAGPPELFGVFSNETVFPGDHVIIYVVRQWSQSHMPTPNREIAAVDFFPLDGLPTDVTPGTRRRLAELTTGAVPAGVW